MGEKQAILIGHDWGAVTTWNTVLLHPDRFSAMLAMSVPNGGRGATHPMEAMKASFGDNFYYILYHQEPGVAEAEHDADPRGLLSRLYCFRRCAARSAHHHRSQAFGGSGSRSARRGALPWFTNRISITSWANSARLVSVAA